MFISIPKEFFVPVVFGDGFILNEENGHLELDTDMYRESTDKKKADTNKVVYTGESKSLKEKKDTVTAEVKAIEKKEIPEKVEEVKKEKVAIEPIYVPLKSELNCKKDGNIFDELDEEYISGVSGKQCNKA